MGNANVWAPETKISGNMLSVPQSFTLTANQTQVELTKFKYAVGTNALEVYKNGLLLDPETDWVEVNSSQINLLVSVAANDKLVVIGKVGITGNIDIIFDYTNVVETQPTQYGDGEEVTFNTPATELVPADHMIVILGGGYFAVPNVDYIINSEGNVVFTIAPEDGVTVDIRYFRPVLDTNNSTVTPVANFSAARKLAPTVDGQLYELLGHTNKGVGGGLFYYDAKDTTSTDNNGTVIVTESGRRLKRQNTDFLTVQDFGAIATQETDTAAVESMIAAGLSVAYLPARKELYKIYGVETTSYIALQGLPTEDTISEIENLDGSKPILECNGNPILTVGDITSMSEAPYPFKDFDIYATGDCLEGVFTINGMLSADVLNVQARASETHLVGTLFKCNRTYKFDFKVNNRIVGYASIELGYNAGTEVVDTINFAGSYVQGNYFMFTRSGLSNPHNFDLSGLKCRNRKSVDEGVITNQGETTLTNAITAGATSITVSDASQLCAGALGENHIIYIGYGDIAEQVRVASVAGNIITLDPATPCRFDHTNNMYGTGVGEPVIFGPVFITARLFRAIGCTTAHFEQGWAALHIEQPAGWSISNIYTTCRHLFMCEKVGDSNTIMTISGGNAGWTEQSLLYRPAWADDDENDIVDSWDILSYPRVTAPWVAQVDDSANTRPLWNFKGGDVTVQAAVLADTAIDAAKITDAIVMMGSYANLTTLTDGKFLGQRISITYIQDSGGFSDVGTFSANVTVNEPIVPSVQPYARDNIVFEWDGSGWIERFRTPRQLYPLVEANTAQLVNETSNINTRWKSKGMLVVNTTDDLTYRAEGSDPIDVWVSMNGVNFIDPGYTETWTLDSSYFVGSQTSDPRGVLAMDATTTYVLSNQSPSVLSYVSESYSSLVKDLTSDFTFVYDIAEEGAAFWVTGDSGSIKKYGSGWALTGDTITIASAQGMCKLGSFYYVVTTGGTIYKVDGTYTTDSVVISNMLTSGNATGIATDGTDLFVSTTKGKVIQIGVDGTGQTTVLSISNALSGINFRTTTEMHLVSSATDTVYVYTL